MKGRLAGPNQRREKLRGAWARWRERNSRSIIDLVLPPRPLHACTRVYQASLDGHKPRACSGILEVIQVVRRTPENFSGRRRKRSFRIRFDPPITKTVTV